MKQAQINLVQINQSFDDNSISHPKASNHCKKSSKSQHKLINSKISNQSSHLAQEISTLMQQDSNKLKQNSQKKQRKSNKSHQNANVFKSRRKNQQEKQQDTQILQNNQILENLQQNGQKIITPEEETKKLKKKISKAPKPKAPAKIRVKNKFFADINIEEQKELKQPSQNDKIIDGMDNNLIQQQLSNKSIVSNNKSKKLELILQKSIVNVDSQSKFQLIVQKTQFLRARHQFRKLDEDVKYKSYVKKKLQQVKEAEEVIIQSLQVPQLYKNKLINASIYYNCQKKISSETDLDKKIENEKLSKQLTAQQILKQRKMLKDRNYFYKKLNEKIKQQKQANNLQSAAQIKQNHKLVESVKKNFESAKKKQDKLNFITQERKLTKKTKTAQNHSEHKIKNKN